jgi:hypothetical protein
MKIKKIHWLIKFSAGIAVGLAIGLGIGKPLLAVIIAIYFGTALSRGTWRV